MADRRRDPQALSKARALWKANRFAESLREYNRAIVSSPQDLQGLIEAARAHGARFRADRSRALLERALKFGARRAEVQHAVGESYRMLGRAADAEACFRRACRLGDAVEPRLALAEMLERRHALDDADEYLAQVLRADPQRWAARLLRARLERRRGRPDPAASLLRQMIAAGGPNGPAVAAAHGELAETLDELGDYAGAWQAILTGKELLRDRAAPAWETAQFVLARCRRMMDELTPGVFARWSSSPVADAPLRIALLTGFPRTGTTLLEQALDAHPEIVASEEVEAFSADVFPALNGDRPPDYPIVAMLEELTPTRINEARQAYLNAMESMLGAPIGERVHVDKNPAMMMMIPPLRRLFPELKLLVALRDPRDVVVSCFMRYLPINPVSACFLTLERTVERYILDMQAWLRLRDMIDDWTEVRYESAVANFRGEASRALVGLGVSWDDAVLRYRDVSRTKVIRSPTYAAVTKPVYATSVGRWRHYESQMAPVLDLLAPMTRALGYDS